MRLIALDTETTGLFADSGDRIIEIGCVELVNRKRTGRNWHHYLNPGRDSHADAFKVHGISNEFLFDKPAFSAVADELLRYLEGAEVVIPNSVDLRALQSDQALDTLLAALAAQRESLIQQHGRRVPLFVKIAPDLDPAQIDWIAACLRRHDMDGVIATNTTTSRLAVAGLRHGEEAGGLSGAPLLLASNQVVRRLRAALGPDFPIIGVGGIMSAEDAQSKIEAGADVVQIYTGLIYRGPSLVVAIAKRLKKLRVSSPRSAV